MTIEQTATADNTPSKPPIFHAFGSVIHAASHGARELTHLVAEVHGTIRQLPLPFNREFQPHHRHAPFPYRLVAHGFQLLARMSRTFLPANTEFSHPHARRAHAALNGVCGDKLDDWRSPLASPVTLRNADGTLMPLSEWTDPAAKGQVLFIHGLCCSELDWQGSEHLAFVDQLSRKGYRVGWLRYNSGRGIPENGAEISAWLDMAFADTRKKRPLILIGHSMGGLLIRSACEQAARQESTWLKRVTHAAYLGSPHFGAPLERLGNAANGLLGYTPYTKPFMRLGNIRSQGIRDLRTARLTVDETQPPLQPQIEHLFLAGALTEPRLDHVVGDGLVPVYSALAQDHAGDLLSAPHVHRAFIDKLGHIAMMTDAQTYDVLREWLGVH